MKKYSIGKTFLGRNIPLFRIGDGAPLFLIIASVHAREHITTDLTMELVKNYKGDACFDFIPMLNIDGVLLAKYGLNSVADEEIKKRLLSINKGNADFSLWKANANAVDLNVNFDADWGKGLSNVTYPAPENFIGSAPNSEIETKSIVKLLKSYRYPLILCYHSKGEEIYFGYKENESFRVEAEAVANKLSYALKKSDNSAGGIKDFYAKNFLGLGLTIEVGEDRFSHPYPLSELSTLVKKHDGTLELYAEIGGKIARSLYERGT